jgi:hypothetical protein
MALWYLGSTDEIQNLETDASDEARGIKLFYTHTLNAMLQRYDWNWATVYAHLQLAQLHPNDEWKYAYKVPSDCLFFRRIWNGRHVDTKYDTIRFVKGKTPQGQVIYTNHGRHCEHPPGTILTPQEIEFESKHFSPLGVYTTKSFTEADMPPMFVDAFAMILSCEIAVKYGGPGASNQREKNMLLADQLWSLAVVRDANEIRPDEEYISDIAKAHQMGGIPSMVGRNGGRWEALPNNYNV